jgi:hypothetical protein
VSIAETDCSCTLAEALAIHHDMILRLVKTAAGQHAPSALSYKARMKPYLYFDSPRAPTIEVFSRMCYSTPPITALDFNTTSIQTVTLLEQDCFGALLEALFALHDLISHLGLIKAATR